MRLHCAIAHKAVIPILHSSSQVWPLSVFSWIQKVPLTTIHSFIIMNRTGLRYREACCAVWAELFQQVYNANLVFVSRNSRTKKIKLRMNVLDIKWALALKKKHTLVFFSSSRKRCTGIQMLHGHYILFKFCYKIF